MELVGSIVTALAVGILAVALIGFIFARASARAEAEALMNSRLAGTCPPGRLGN